jgi:hypothetical protein
LNCWSLEVAASVEPVVSVEVEEGGELGVEVGPNEDAIVLQDALEVCKEDLAFRDLHLDAVDQLQPLSLINFAVSVQRLSKAQLEALEDLDYALFSHLVVL